jgi:hypothetical protein
MSAKQSNLSAQQYGYDIVVATTQESINRTMREYLTVGDQPVVSMYWIYDDDNNPQAISEADLLASTNGTDPFSVKNYKGKESAAPANVKNMYNSGFMYGFRAQIGIPPGYELADVPDIITLDPKAGTVTFNLMCSEFKLVSSVYGPNYTYTSTNQPDGGAWIFSSKVPLKTVLNNNNLPQAVQQQLMNLGADAFSVQQLIFDLDNAYLESTPTIVGVDPGTDAYTGLTNEFLGAYFSAMKQKGAPVLGFTITANNATPDPSTLKLSDLKMEANPFVDAAGVEIDNPTEDQQYLTTLNYLCAANGKKVLNTNTFNWNWLDNNSDALSFDGITAINRNTLVEYFKDQLNTYTLSNSFKPSVRVYLSDAGTIVNYEWGMTAAQPPVISTPATGQTVLSYSYSDTSYDEAGLDGDTGQMRLSPAFNLSVDFIDNTIVIKQSLQVYVDIKSGLTEGSGNVIDQTITDTYSIGVDENGKLGAVLGKPVTTNNPKIPGVNGFLNFFSEFNSLAGDVATWAQGFTAMSFTDVPVSVMQGFVFPGGKTFTFKDAMFSDNQDLISHIHYVDPS